MENDCVFDFMLVDCRSCVFLCVSDSIRTSGIRAIRDSDPNIAMMGVFSSFVFGFDFGGIISLIMLNSFSLIYPICNLAEKNKKVVVHRQIIWLGFQSNVSLLPKATLMCTNTRAPRNEDFEILGNDFSCFRKLKTEGHEEYPSLPPSLVPFLSGSKHEIMAT